MTDARKLEIAREALIKLSYWFSTDQEIIDAMDPDTKRDHLRQAHNIKTALERTRGSTPEQKEKAHYDFLIDHGKGE